MALIVTARMAGFKPGTSPPPVRIPMTPFFVFPLAIKIAFSTIAPQHMPTDSLVAGAFSCLTLLKKLVCGQRY
jgi:hypothetical protein